MCIRDSRKGMPVAPARPPANPRRQVAQSAAALAQIKTLPAVFALGNYEFRRGQPLSIGDSLTHF